MFEIVHRYNSKAFVNLIYILGICIFENKRNLGTIFTKSLLNIILLWIMEESIKYFDSRKRDKGNNYLLLLIKRINQQLKSSENYTTKSYFEIWIENFWNMSNKCFSRQDFSMISWAVEFVNYFIINPNTLLRNIAGYVWNIFGIYMQYYKFLMFIHRQVRYWSNEKPLCVSRKLSGYVE